VPLALGIVQKEGWCALFRGLAPNLVGVTHGTIQFSLYEAMKARYRVYQGEEGSLRARDHILLAAWSKMVASLVTYPCQVVRTVMQDGEVTQRPQARQVVRQLVVEGGPKALYRSLGKYTHLSSLLKLKLKTIKNIKISNGPNPIYI